MTTDTWLLYVGTVLLFMITPGPSHLLMLSVSMSNGFQRSLGTAAGDLSANPKAVVFFAALFPQFLDPQHDPVPQITILGMTYIVIDGAFLTPYGRAASWIAPKLRSRRKAWVDRGAGASLVTAAVLLGLRANERT